MVNSPMEISIKSHSGSIEWVRKVFILFYLGFFFGLVWFGFGGLFLVLVFGFGFFVVFLVWFILCKQGAGR